MFYENGVKKINLFLQHGWAFDKNCWQKFLSELPENGNYSCFYVDRGYFRNPVRMEASEGNGYNVVVCHSLGLHLVDESILAEADLVVVLSGFVHFHGQNKRDGIFSRKHVKRMLTELDDDPVNLLKKFYRDCSFPAQDLNVSAIDLQLLKQDLLYLDSNHFAPGLLGKVDNILILHGKKDRIVPLERGKHLADMLGNSTFIEIGQAGHGLPFTHPDICWKHIFKGLPRK